MASNAESVRKIKTALENILNVSYEPTSSEVLNTEVYKSRANNIVQWTPNIGGYSVWKLLDVTIPSPRISEPLPHLKCMEHSLVWC